VAVVVNYKKSTNAEGKVEMKPLTEAETIQITNLVKEAMGFNAERGDSINVVNTPFAQTTQEALPELPWWKQPQNIEYIEMAKTAGKYLLMALALLILYLRVLKPLMKKFSEISSRPAASLSPQLQSAEMTALPGQSNYQDNLSRAQKMASEDPRVVANIVKTWVGSNE